MVGTTDTHEGLVIRGDGMSFEQLEFKGGPLRGVWGTAADDLWVIPYDSPAQHWDGSSWALTDSSAAMPMLSTWGTNSDDVWAVGLEGTILHYDGSNWSTSESGTEENLWSVWGSDSDDVWAAGGLGTLLRWDGKRWKKLEVTATLPITPAP
jgi:hypothetical protein